MLHVTHLLHLQTPFLRHKWGALVAEESSKLQVGGGLLRTGFTAPQPLHFTHLLISIFAEVSAFKHSFVREFRWHLS